MKDFKLEDHGTVWTFEAMTAPAREYLNEIGLEEWMKTAKDHFAMDKTPARHLACELLGQGFTVGFE